MLLLRKLFVATCTAVHTYENMHTTITAANVFLRPVPFMHSVQCVSSSRTIFTLWRQGHVTGVCVVRICVRICCLTVFFPTLLKIVPGDPSYVTAPLQPFCKRWYTDLARFSMPATGCSVQFGCQNRLKLPFLHVFCPTVNGSKDAKMWRVRGFALHPKDALPTDMDFHHSIIAVRVLTGFLRHPQMALHHTMRQRTFQKQHATHNLEYTICTTQDTIHSM